MSEQTKIEWCDSTWNPWIGCTRVSPACDDCYAARSTPARALGVEWGAGMPRRRTSAANWKLPERWDASNFRECIGCGARGDEKQLVGIRCTASNNFLHITKPARRRVFCASLADWLDNEVPVEWLVDLLDLIRRTPNLDWLLLTKRIGNWRARVGAALAFQYWDLRGGELPEQRRPLALWLASWLNGRKAPQNIWLGATVIDQVEADRDVPKLLAVPARIRFLSIEPMLGPVDLMHVRESSGHTFNSLLDKQGIGFRGERLHWVIVGGESGPKARPMHPDSARLLRDQCLAAGVPFFFKQWGEWLPFNQREPGQFRDSVSFPTSYMHWRVGKKIAGRLIDGRTWDEFPEVAG